MELPEVVKLAHVWTREIQFYTQSSHQAQCLVRSLGISFSCVTVVILLQFVLITGR
jgi:hypothetical protein